MSEVQTINEEAPVSVQPVSGTLLKHPSKPCPLCGKMISTKPGSMRIHIAGHKKREALEKKKAIEGVVITEETKTRMKRALEAQKLFQESPHILISADMSDKIKAILKLYCPEALPVETFDPANPRQKPKKHAYIGRKDEANIDCSRGYMPVLDDKGRHVEMEDNMLLYWIPQEIYEARQIAAGEKSEQFRRSSQAWAEGGVREEVRETKVGKMEDL